MWLVFLRMGQSLSSPPCSASCLCCCFRSPISPVISCVAMCEQRREREQERERWERGIWRRRGNEDRWNRGEEEEEVGKRNIVLKWRGSDGDENVKCNSTLRRLETVSVLCPPLFLSPSFSAYLWRLFLEIALLQIKAHKHMHSLSHTYISLYFYLWGL